MGGKEKPGQRKAYLDEKSKCLQTEENTLIEVGVQNIIVFLCTQKHKGTESQFEIMKKFWR